MSNIINNYVDGWKRIVDFKGKSTRTQFWTFYLVNFLLDLILSAILGSFLGGLVSIISILVLIAGLASCFRRLHDTNRSAWNLLWFLLPVIGWIILIVYFVTPSK